MPHAAGGCTRAHPPVCRLRRPFAPPTATLKEVHDSVPKHLLKSGCHDAIEPSPPSDPDDHLENQFRAVVYVARDIIFTLFLYKCAASITPWAASDFGGHVSGRVPKKALKAALWLVYWWMQSMVNAGIFCLGPWTFHLMICISR